MLYIGILFILLGIYTIFEDSYDLEKSIIEKRLLKLNDSEIKKTGFSRVKHVVGLFCIVIGIFSAINYFYY